MVDDKLLKPRQSFLIILYNRKSQIRLIYLRHCYFYLFENLSRAITTVSLTFKNLASYIYDRRTATLQMLHFIYVFQQI
jgi:hypothetical protein